MVAFISIVLALSLLGLIVYGLHKYQTMEVEYHVDRTMPLPPIKGGSSKPAGNEQLAQVSGKPPRSRVRNPENSAIKAARKKSRSPAHTRKAKASWQDQLAEAKNNGNFELAFDICQQHFPLWSAYNQACITFRAQLKSIDPSADSAEKILQRLYITAAMAELLHDKSDKAQTFKLHQLRSLDLQELEQLEFPYQALGYAQLRLIRKSDVKLMLNAWGRPDSHQLPREYHAQWWAGQIAGMGSK